MADWQATYLRALGIKPTPEAKARLSQWQRWEGGSTNNSARNNYMNTKQPMPGSWDAIGNGVQGYHTLAQGALAFAHTLRNGNYPNMERWIATGEGDPSRDLEVWVGGPGAVGTPQAATYAAKVLGTKVPVGPKTAVVQKTQGNVVSTTPEVQSAQDGAAAVRAQARQNLQDIATGQKSATESLAEIPKVIAAFHASLPKIEAPQAPGPTGDGSLETQATALVRKYIGTKYVWGGESPDAGFDCSGLLQYVWKSLGVSIPRTTYQQWDAGKKVDPNALKPGDAVFFTGSDPMNGKPGHVGMYLGEGKLVEAPGRGKNVRISTLAGRTDFVGARRFG